MDKVADPKPALALTTSVPASCMRSVSSLIFSGDKFTCGVHCEIRGIMVLPAWPPTTGLEGEKDRVKEEFHSVFYKFVLLYHDTKPGSSPCKSAMKVFALTTSRVVTPKIFLHGTRKKYFDSNWKGSGNKNWPWIQLSTPSVNFSRYWYRAVHRVRYNGKDSFRTNFRSGLS